MQSWGGLLPIAPARSWTGSACSWAHIPKTLDSHPYPEQRSVDKTLPSFSDTDISFNFSDTSFLPLGMSLLLLSELLCREIPCWEDGVPELTLAWLCSPWMFCLPALHVFFHAAFTQCNSFVTTIPLLIHPPARCHSSLAEECGVCWYNFPSSLSEYTVAVEQRYSRPLLTVVSWGTCAGTANLSWGRGSLRAELLRIFSQDRCREIPMSILWSIPACPCSRGESLT